jgi:molybdopterin molybdotransferase
MAPDDPIALARQMEQGLACDLLLLSGGVSVGKYDFVEQVLSELGAEFLLTGAEIQPGRPVVCGRMRRNTKDQEREFVYFFGLPGNPVSTMVTFDLFVRPIVDALCGAAPQKLRFLKAPLKSEIKIKTGLTRFLPALLSGKLDQVEVERAPWQGSGDIAGAARSDCYVVIPPDRDRIPAGEMVSVMLR